MIMSFRAPAFTLLLVLPLAQVAAQSKELRIGVDRRVELVAIIFKLAGSEEFSPTHLPQYSADIDQFFGAQRNHQAVTLARGLRERYGVGQARVMAIPIRLTDPPELKERVPFDSSGGWPAPPAETRRFVEAARRFAIDSRANDFFESHRALYDSVNGRIRPALERAVDLAWFAPYFGIPSDRMFVVVPLLVAAEGNYGPCVQPPSGPRECYSIVGNSAAAGSGPKSWPIFMPSMRRTATPIRRSPRSCRGSSRTSILCPIAFPRCRRATTCCGPRSCHCPSRMDRTPWIRAYKKWWCDSTGQCGTTVGASCRCWDPPAQRPSRTSASPSLRGGQSTPRASPSPLERGC